MKTNQGFLLVIDGIDGSGKTTQIELLKQYLASQGLALQVEIISFPRYGDNLYVDLVQKYLEGEFGPIGQIDSHFIALAYAGDRMLAKGQIEKWLSEGKIVIANRYVSASKAHLGVNISEEKRTEFVNWIDKLEYETNRLPKEDMTIILNVDPGNAQENARQDDIKDIHEEDLTHLQKAALLFSELAKDDPSWVVVNCMENGKMQTKEVIHQKVIDVLKQKLIVLK